MLTDEQITKAAFKYHELTGAHHSTFHSGAKWANDQNAARIAELEAQKEELIKLLERIQLSVQNPYVSLPDFEYNSITEMLHKYPPKKNA